MKMAQTVWVLLSILAASYVCDAYKILAIFPIPSKSHSILGNGVVRHLLNAGHEVTLLTPYVIKNPPPNLYQVDTSSLNEADIDNFRNIKMIMDGKVPTTDTVFFQLLTNVLATKTLEDKNVQKLLSDKTQHFDVVIAAWLHNELFAGIPAVFDAPLIWFASTEPDSMMLSTIDDYLNPSYNGFITNNIPPFSFMERLSELWHHVKVVGVRETIGIYLQSRDYNRLIAPHIEARGKVPPSYSELRLNASLVLGNSHPSMGVATRLPQCYKHIGGFHIEDEIKPLPEDLKKLMDNSKHGVIYFSMGSKLQSRDLPDELMRDLVQMFGTLDQTVLWKFEEVVPNLPKNLHILQWAPEQSILAHPNVLLFITDGGILSTIETIKAGKPAIGIPVQGHQFTNVIRAVNKGFAKKVDLSYTMVGDLKAAIGEVLSNPKYFKKAKELSFIFHDRSTTPGVELVHWVEHVVKTRGAPHLRSPALLVPWYQKCYLDLTLFVIFTSIIRMKILKYLTSLVRRWWSKKNDKKKED